MRLAFARRQAIVQLMFTSTVLALLLVQPLRANDAPLAVATVAANETTSLCTFDPASLASLQLGDAFPPAFAALGAHIDAKSRARFAAMQLVRRVCDASGELFVFEHPQAQAVHASLLLRDGRVVGTIESGGDLRIALNSRSTGRSQYRVEHASLDSMCASDELAAPSNKPRDVPLVPGEGGVAGTCSAINTVDIFICYTDAAVAQAGSETGILDSINFAVADSNSIYSASGITLTMRLVGTRRMTGYVEASSMSSDLYALRDGSDGLLDSAVVARDLYGADLVSLIRADGGGACGIAWLGGGESNSGYAFNVVALGCIAGRTFTHECGHNMGCCHAPGDGGGCTSGGYFPYSVGHRFTGTNGSQYRTVMAYTPGTRIPRFSSPTTIYQGTATGLVDERDNARSIQELRANFTAYRPCACVGDLDGDATVGASDLALLLSAWGVIEVGGASYDYDGSGANDGGDLAALLANWGPCS